ncbi:Acyl-coenzyme A oxidase-like protein [Grifola frondosa]|uniref:Acyl-coenzyme A oxidase-like protein n=1 Tax=Grifola frondosa TaxID=5627 RepID=A0A1C7MJU6_GRIFR|nr:Acyl-coenzyme A oxidase-like protein [Grifola frondosa]
MAHPAPVSNHPLYRLRAEFLTNDERVALAYQRAKLMLDTYKLNAEDILHCTPKYWAMQSDPAMPLDIACFTIISSCPDLQPLLHRLLAFEAVGLYLLSERGHGLDGFNIETTATKTDTGFILNTPREEAAKMMPATTPLFRIPKVALVMARLIVDGTDRGACFFIVPICDSKQMFRGVTSTRLPPRSGTAPLDFAITNFHNIQLPPSALLGTSLAAPKDPLSAWWEEVWRIPIGSGAVAAPLVQAIKHAAYIGGRYSLVRHITGKDSAAVPIITFRTQQWPVLQAIAVAMVLDTWYPQIIQQTVDMSTEPQVRHGLSVVVKTTVCRQFMTCIRDIAERCGAQGTFDHNFLARIEADARGIIVAEGDVVTLCIRLLGELLLGRYTLPPPALAKSLLARHASSVFEHNADLLRTLPGGRVPIQALGHAYAYAAAARAGIPQPLLDLYECVAIRADPAWYSECAGLDSSAQRAREARAVTCALAHLQEYLDALDIKEHVTAPIVEDHVWKAWLAKAPTYHGTADPESLGSDGAPSKVSARLLWGFLIMMMLNEMYDTRTTLDLDL